MTTPEKRRITAEDLNKIITIEDPNLSPDGAWVAFVQVTPDPMEKGYKRNIWLATTDGSRTMQFTRSNKDSVPRWSPDGTRLAFVSGRGGKPQIFIASVQAPGGEPRQLTSNANGANSPAWSPDGQHIAYLSGTTPAEIAKEDSGEKDPKPADSLEAKQRKERQEEDEKNRFDPRFVWRIPYRTGTTFLDDRAQHVYVVPTADGLEGDAAKPRRLTKLDVSYASPEWSPDGQFIYTVRARRLGTDTPWRENNIFKIQVADGAETHFDDADHYVFSAVKVSPDGKWLAYDRNPANKTDLNGRFSIQATDGSAPITLNTEFDRNIAMFRWTADNQLIVAAMQDGNMPVYQLDIASQTYTLLITGTQMLQGMDIAPNGAIAYAASTPENPSELFFKAADGEATSLTQVNHKFLDEVMVQPTHEIRFMSPAGVEIHGWYNLPPDYENGKRYPLIVDIHGGPHIMWGAAMQSMWHEWQFQAARGYVVFSCNPRGSDGYGEAHTSSLHAAWGMNAMPDVLAGVDWLIEKGIVDAEKLAVTGGSYGGYLTTWIIAHTQRFKAAVSQRGVYNLLSFYGTSDVPLLIQNEYDVDPWENPMLLWQESPIAHAHNIKTPLLIIHAENDYRVPIEQGEQLFAYIRRSGGTVNMLRYPREGHEMSRSGEPTHRVHHLEEMLKWFDTYCLPVGE